MHLHTYVGGLSMTKGPPGMSGGPLARAQAVVPPGGGERLGHHIGPLSVRLL